MRGLTDLGKRIERLFYFGGILMLACLLDLYFVSAAVYNRGETPEGIQEVLDLIVADKARLTAAYGAKQSSPRPADPARDAAVAEARKNLGLPPAAKAPAPTVSTESYAEALSSVLRSGSLQLSSLLFIRAYDPSKSPEDLINHLIAYRDEVRAKKIMIWGVESPSSLPFRYGETSYKIPVLFIAHALMYALMPLYVAWLGSFYLTRQRELLQIKRLTRHEQTFPHVLNIFNLQIVSSDNSSGPFKRTRKASRALLEMQRLLPSLLRTAIIVVFALPMGLVLSYCGLELSVAKPDTFAGGWSFFLVLLFGSFVFMQTIILIVQDWYILWRKEFYA